MALAAIGERLVIARRSHIRSDHCLGGDWVIGQSGVQIWAPNAAGLEAFLDAVDHTETYRSIEGE